MIAERAIACGTRVRPHQGTQSFQYRRKYPLFKELLAQHGWQVQRAIAIQKLIASDLSSLCCQWPEAEWRHYLKQLR